MSKNKPITVQQIGELIKLAKSGKVDRVTLQGLIDHPDEVAQAIQGLKKLPSSGDSNHFKSSEIFRALIQHKNPLKQYEFWIEFEKIRSRHESTKENEKIIKWIKIASNVSCQDQHLWLVIPKPSFFGGYWQAWQYMDKLAEQVRNDYISDAALNLRGFEILPEYALQIIELEKKFPGDFIIISFNLGTEHLHESCNLAMSKLRTDELILGPYELTAILCVFSDYIPGAISVYGHNEDKSITPCCLAAYRQSETKNNLRLHFDHNSNTIKWNLINHLVAVKGGGVATCSSFEISDYKLFR